MNSIERKIASALRKHPAYAQQLLKSFFDTKRISVHTRLQYVKAMESYVKTINSSLEEACNQSLYRWFRTVQKQIGPGSIAVYTIKLRALYRFHLEQQGLTHEEAHSKAKELFRKIPLRELQKEADKNNELRNKILTPEEFQQLLNATDHPRLRAFFVTAKESGARPEELTSTRIRHLQFHQHYAILRVNGKTGERAIPLIQSIPYLRAWLQVHPDKNNPDAPLFAVVYKGKVRFPNPWSLSQTFKRIRQRANIKRKIYPYMLRHTRLTDLAERNIGEYQLKKFAGWTPDSKMASRYVHLTAKAALKAVLEIEGLALPSQEKKPDIITTRTCPRCNTQNEHDAKYCAQCSLILDEKVLYQKQQQETRTDGLMDMLIQHPMVQQAIKEAVKQLWTQGKITETLTK